jgi:hypothetical protein
MKKVLSLLLTLVFVGSMMVVMGCAPKQDATQAAPAMEAPAAAMSTTPGAEVPAAATTPVAGEAAPAE